MTQTVDGLFQSLPGRLKTADAASLNAIYHFKISGPTGGDYSVCIRDGQCTVQSGLTGDAKCTVSMADDTYIAVETGKTAPEMAFMAGKVKVDNIPELMKYTKLFNKTTA